MKIKITNDGFLLLERKGLFKSQFCCFGVDQNSFCGDWCPLFGEPFPSNIIDWNNLDSLSLCNKILTGEIIDERDERKSH